MTIEELIKESHQTALDKGWWDKKVFGEERPVGDQFSNFHAEISEAWEEYRNGHKWDEIYYSEKGKPEGIAVELADCLIRIFDSCGQYNIPLEKALQEKLEYNKTRPIRHGNKKA